MPSETLMELCNDLGTDYDLGRGHVAILFEQVWERMRLQAEADILKAMDKVSETFQID